MQKTILLTSNMYRPNIGGIENSLYHLAHSFIELGYRCVICVSDIGPSGESLPLFEQDKLIEIVRYPVNGKRGIARFVGHWLSSFRTLKHIKHTYSPDVVVCRFHQICVVLKMLGMENVTYLVPGVVKYQNDAGNLASDTLPFKARLKRRLNFKLNHYIQRLAFKLADRLMVFSQNMFEQVSGVEPGLISSIKIVKPGVDTARFKPVNTSNKFAERQRLNLSETNEPVFLCVGRFVRAKGFDLAIHALALMPHGKLWIVGEGEELQFYRELIEQLSLQHRVVLIPRSPEPETFYALADYFVMSSRYEPLGQTLLEALSCGLPVVAFSDLSGVTTATSELIQGDNLYLADSLNAEGLAKAMLNAATSYVSDGYEREAQISRELAETKFSWKTLCVDLVE